MAFDYLTKKSTLWFLFAATICLTISFAVVMQLWGFGIIDEMFVASQINDHIGAMTAKQKQAHIWTTATLDVLYPFVYAGFFAGVALKAFGRVGLWLAIPAILCIPVDLTEGYAQVMLLSGHVEYMGLKTTTTPLKYGLFFSGLLITTVGLFKLYKSSK